MADGDPHAPTSAGPDPTPVVNPSEATWRQPPGSAMLGDAGAGAPPDSNPEVMLGAAFAGGLVAGLVLKRITRGRG